MNYLLLFTFIISVCCQSTTSPHGIKSMAYDLSTWMTDLYDILKERKMNEIKMVGTHDSGASDLIDVYKSHSNDGKSIKIITVNYQTRWSKTQHYNVKKQLEVGVRYFDFRPYVEEDKNIHLSHGLVGENMTDALISMREFVMNATNSKELIMIKIKDNKKEKTLTTIWDEFIKQLYSNRSMILTKDDIQSKTFSSLTFGDIISTGKRFILLLDTSKDYFDYDKDGNALHPDYQNYSKYFFSLKDNIISDYKGKTKTQKMFDDNIDLANSIEKDNDKIVIYHYTLTANFWYILTHIKQSNNVIKGIEYLTSKPFIKHPQCNLEHFVERLYQIEFTRKNKNIGGVVLLDFVEESKVQSVVNWNLM